MAEMNMGSASNEALVRVINDALKNNGVLSKLYFLTKDTQITVKKTNGEYRKRPGISGDKFSLTSAYVGKKKDVILVFTPNIPNAEYKFVEFAVTDAINALDSGFSAFLQKAMTESKDIAKAIEEAQLKQKEVEEQNKKLQEKALLEDEEYGMF